MINNQNNQLNKYITMINVKFPDIDIFTNRDDDRTYMRDICESKELFTLVYDECNGFEFKPTKLAYVLFELQKYKDVVNDEFLKKFLSLKNIESMRKQLFKPDSRKRSLLWIASCEGHEDIVEALLIAGSKLESRTDGCTPLWIASSNGHENIVKVLINAGSKVEACNGEYTPLGVASSNGHVGVIKILINAKAKLTIRCKSNPLWIASSNGHLEVVKILLGLKAGVKKEDHKNTSTPLWIASCNGHENIVKALIYAGSNKEEINDGHTPLSIAKINKHVSVISILGGTVDDISLIDAVTSNNTSIVKRLLETGVSVDGFHQAFLNKNIDILRLLSLHVEVRYNTDCCPICLENVDGDDVITLKCGHSVHFTCQFLYMREGESSMCTVCRQTL